VAKKDKPDRDLSVGDKLRIKLHDGRIVDAAVCAIDGEKLQVDFGHEETALVNASQVVA
jgi:molybdopterin-binding protein